MASPEGIELKEEICQLQQEDHLQDDSTAVHMSFKWNDESTRTLIRIRNGTKEYFTGKRNTAKTGWEFVLREMNLEGIVSVKQAKKKWDNLLQKYKEVKNARRKAIEDTPEDAAVNEESWPFYAEMEQAIDGAGSVMDIGISTNGSVVTLPVVIASITNAEGTEAGTSDAGDALDYATNQAFESVKSVDQTSDEDDADVECPTTRQLRPPQPSKRRRKMQDDASSTVCGGGGDDVYVQLLRESREDWLKMHETYERQGEQMIALFAELVKSIKKD